MPKHKDLKRVIRSRMQKTGESYTAARLRLLEKSDSKQKNGPPPAADYATLAGMSDTAIEAKTGRNWERWAKTLDRDGAAAMTHRQIADLVHEKYAVPEWWTQAVTVGYERIRGLREIGQRRDGSYEANKSKTVAAPIGRLYRAFSHAPTRRRWLPAAVKIRTTIRDKSMRITWEDGTSVEAYFIAKSPGKAQVAIQHRKLADKATVARLKTYWAERLSALTELLDGS